MKTKILTLIIGGLLLTILFGCTTNPNNTGKDDNSALNEIDNQWIEDNTDMNTGDLTPADEELTINEGIADWINEKQEINAGQII